ncbi:MAG: ABC transporter permease subunit [Betaproteobacteria bacterium]|nr:ABC transporter permease subunit [Betaproteobacteria bacterium]
MESFRRIADVILLLVALVAFWQGLYWFVGEVGISSPWETVLHALELLGQPQFWPHVRESLHAFAYSLVLAWIGGVAIGVWLGAHRLSGDVAEPILVALYSLPKVTLYPLILLVFGLGMPAKVAFGAIHGIFPVMIFTLNAVKNIKPVYLKTARSMNLSPGQAATTILIPATLPEVVTGLRVGFSLTLLGVLIGEMFASQRGLGFIIINAIGLDYVPRMMAVTLMLFVFAALANAGLLALDRHLHKRV